MKTALTILLITGFVGITVFGVFAMNHGADHGHNGCIAATANGVDCPKEESPLAFLNFHLNAFRNFSTAIFDENLASALLLFVLLAFVAALGFIARIQPSPAVITNYRRRQFLESYSFPFQRALTHWLTLHENSPAFP